MEGSVQRDKQRTAEAALQAGVAQLLQQQEEGGEWQGEMIWCSMITAQVVMVSSIIDRPLPVSLQERIRQNLLSEQREDGSWGLHPHSEGYLFVTGLSYVALRLLGAGPEEPAITKACEWIRERGGVCSIPTWGKLWLSLMNLYEWEGVHKILPELWLLPESNPLHPRRYYCHTRLIYLAMGVLQARKVKHPVTPLIEALREELYCQPYDSIHFRRHRGDLYEGDVYAWPGWVMKTGYAALSVVDRWVPKRTRQRAIEKCMRLIRHEVKETAFVCLSPVNGLLNVLACWSDDQSDPLWEQAWAGVDHWCWNDPIDGARYTGARSQTWDTAFAVQALCAGPFAATHREPLQAALRYFEANQCMKPIKEGDASYRLSVVGGYCFSDKLHRWPVSDCTAEALSAMYQIEQHTGASLSVERLAAAASFLLQRQNADGGWGSYENRRGNWFLERLNPSEMYGSCMIEGSYVECTASCLHGLQQLRQMQAYPSLPDALRGAIEAAMPKGVAFLLSCQGRDGSWPGFWGVCLTYGTMFGVIGLRAGGLGCDHPALVRAREWFARTQREDGGWGEDWRACLTQEVTPSPNAQVVQTSWAMIGAMLAGEEREAVLQPAAALLAQRQQADGSWRREDPEGVFFLTSMLHYEMYRSYFPVWALGMFVGMKGVEGAASK